MKERIIQAVQQKRPVIRSPALGKKSSPWSFCTYKVKRTDETYKDYLDDFRKKGKKR